jgi:hypothetical protein
MDNLDQLKKFCEWERAYNAKPDKIHIAEWARDEIIRQRELLKKSADKLSYLMDCTVPMTSQQEECWKALRELLGELKAAVPTDSKEDLT